MIFRLNTSAKMISESSTLVERLPRLTRIAKGWVERYNATTVWLEKGSVPVSKKQFARFVRQYMQYIRRTNGRGADR